MNALDFKVNVNEMVKVKLTKFGISILKQQHDELDTFVKAQGGKGLGEFDLRLDEEGYYKTQLWMLMNNFGHAMEMTNENPFEMEIIVINGEPIGGQRE